MQKSVLDYPFETKPAAAELKEVAPGVHWLRMPLPFALDHINLWLLEDGDSWTLVDCGLATDETRALWRRIFEERLGGRPIGRVLVTHYHPDHVGLAGWLTEHWGVELWMPRTEWLTARALSRSRDDEVEPWLSYYRRAGCEPAFLDEVGLRGAVYARRVSPVPDRYRRLADGQELAIGGRSWRVVIGRGHAPEHALLLCQELGLLISGDQVLPKISPNVSVWPYEPEENPLADFLATLERLRELDPGLLVLPSHNVPFRGLHERLAELAQHHDERLDLLEAACAEPQTALQLARVLFRRPLDSHQMGFAIGETIAHLRFLERRGLLVRDQDTDGVERYRRPA
ncbi:Glyoxylase, beta-lactamase superfamily II [Tistlia consotensis]|uniref:Glyoxylase, beta-lactamase superfamily II n=2 Tax=Tistlia TaxID=1321364 RepID=A0A1Y6C0H1_9PROT|nr:Glyoxylase, beta-lactamase superfamily II [Tistlia consotensis USBA 355]SNR90604.1 Glyoxylase, beta-lactamase superfamily II [Tistlia consotensis]